MEDNYSRQEAPWNDTQECVVTHFVSPDHFYIATRKMAEEAERLREAMEQLRCKPSMREEDFYASDFMIVYHRGQFWRAKRDIGTPIELPALEQGILKKKLFSVLLLDKGEIVKVPLFQTYNVSMSNKLCQQGPLCFRANLADVMPIGEEWTVEAITCFMRNAHHDDLKMLLRGIVSAVSMPIELLFSESFTDAPFTKVRMVETTMSRKLLAEGHARVPIIIEPEEDFLPLKEIRNPHEIGPAISQWLPPCIPIVSDNLSAMTEIRVTYIDGSFQIYGHLEKDVNLLRSMKNYFSSIYDYEDCPEDYKENWRPNEACVAKFNGKSWYRAKVLEVSPDRKEVGIIYIDLGNVRTVKSVDLRIPRAFGDQPILAVRMVLDHTIPPNYGEYFSEQSIKAIEEELAYWKVGITKIVRSRLKSPASIPLPVHLYLRQEMHDGKEEWHNYGLSLIDRGLADYGEVDISSMKYLLHARE